MGTSQDRGREFERRWAERVGASHHSGSGNFYLWRLDASNRGRYLWSCKHTDSEAIRLTIGDILEVEKAAVSEGVAPVMAISINGHEYVLQPAQQWLDEHTEGAKVEFIKPTKHDERLAKRKTSPLFRNDNSNK